MDSITLIAIECENPWIWLGVCKYFWTSHDLMEKLLHVEHGFSIDQDFFKNSIIPYGDIENDNISIYSCIGKSKWIKTYNKGLYKDNYASVQLHCRIYILDKRRINKDERFGNQIFSKDLYSYLIADVLSYHSIIKNRYSLIKRITSISPNKNIIRKICKEYFLQQLSDKNQINKYLICVMTLRLMGIPVKYEIKVNYIETPNVKIYDDELERIKSQIDDERIDKMIEKILRKIQKL